MKTVITVFIISLMLLMDDQAVASAGQNECVRLPSFAGHIRIEKTFEGQCRGFTVGTTPQEVSIAEVVSPSITYGKSKSRRGNRQCLVSTVPPSLDAPSFYKKYCDAGAIPILASAEVANMAKVAASRS